MHGGSYKKRFFAFFLKMGPECNGSFEIQILAKNVSPRFNLVTKCLVFGKMTFIFQQSLLKPSYRNVIFCL